MIKHKLIGRKMLLFTLFIMVLLGTISIVSASDSIADNSSDDSVEPLISDSIDEDDVVGDESDDSNAISNDDALEASSDCSPFIPDSPGPYNHTYDLEPFMKMYRIFSHILNP